MPDAVPPPPVPPAGPPAASARAPDGAAGAGAPTLVRTIGRWGLTAAIVNSVVGSAIFGMPAAVAALTGAWSPLVVGLAGLAILPVVLCFAEVGSRFDAPGGPYLYVREAFGDAAGFVVGWIMLWTRLLSGAAVLNVMVTYLAQLVPWTGAGAGRAATMVVATALVTAINVRGVRQGAWTVNLLTVAKLLPLLLLVVLGALAFDGATVRAQAVAAPDWTEAVLLLMFAYGGFESAVSAAGETRRPREDTAFALVTALALVVVVYAGVQVAVLALLPDAARAGAPVAAALAAGLGPAGRAVGSVAAVVSTYGWLTGFALLVPRVPYAMAERGDLPRAFGRVHARFRTPAVSIVACTAVVLALGLWGTFTATATLSAIARLLVYAAGCAALVPLRRRGPPAGWTAPGGPLLALLGIGVTLWLLGTRTLTQAWMVGALVVAGLLVRVGMRRRAG
jgi:amino acid transporter